ncbi:MAG: 23S rRNA (guanosine(2251)-2'-O)-methyltransferase RlmB [Kiritimatiellae bacterium]|nr:23S rRNA (guanosine(2251)-2'-O)-methyltransferase RlmB [Kiritimatiellia bacterium]
MSKNQSYHAGPREMVSGGEWIYGRNPVEEVLAAGRRTVTEIVLPPPSENEDPQLERIRDEAHSRRIVIRGMDRTRLDKLTRNGHHQGFAIKTTGYPYVGFEEILRDAENDENATVVILDHLEDPQNVGSILRSACAVGVTGVIIPEDRACGITPAAVRASAGGSEYIKVAHVVNLPRAIKELKEAGFWVTALDFGEDARNYTDIDFSGRSALVVGAEGDGVSRLVRENCDFIASLPMPGGFESLNAGVATAVALYEILRQHSSPKTNKQRK